MINKLGTRIYYILNTGAVIFQRYDCISCVAFPSIEDEKQTNMILAEYPPDEIGCIEYPYGEFDALLEKYNANDYDVDVSDTVHTVKFKYVEPEETDIPVEPIEEIETPEQTEIKLLNERLDIISDMMFEMSMGDDFGI